MDEIENRSVTTERFDVSFEELEFSNWIEVETL
jgi:hypothetical protein